MQHNKGHVWNSKWGKPGTVLRTGTRRVPTSAEMALEARARPPREKKENKGHPEQKGASPSADLQMPWPCLSKILGNSHCESEAHSECHWFAGRSRYSRREATPWTGWWEGGEETLGSGTESRKACPRASSGIGVGIEVKEIKERNSQDTVSTDWPLLYAEMKA